MPQLDLILFTSQCSTGIVFVLGFVFFSKSVLPYLSFFVKIEEYELLNLTSISNECIKEQTSLIQLRTVNLKKLSTLSSCIKFVQRKVSITPIYIH